MKILIVGSGGREHAIAWKLAQSRHRPQLYIAPGNAGTAQLGTNLPVKATDLTAMVKQAHQMLDGPGDFVFVGPDDPLALGLVDQLTDAGIRAFGPTKDAARIESSKSWAKELMLNAGIPTAHAETFDHPDKARSYALARPEGSIVIKADGLAAGKGVVIPATYAEASSAIDDFMVAHSLGQAGNRIGIEERLTGPEVSVFAFVSGPHVSAEIAACDYKRAGDGDTGPNTGGMGAYTPPEFWTNELAATIRHNILEPAARAMVAAGYPFNGVIYAGLMLTDEGPKVIEFNSRLGDPETQVILPCLKTDLVDVCNTLMDGHLDTVPVQWSATPHVGVVVASGGYPGKYSTGHPISGLETAAKDGTIFHAGTATLPSGETATAGGRVLTAVASGQTMSAARVRAYSAASQISFANSFYRRDIAARALPSFSR